MKQAKLEDKLVFKKVEKPKINHILNGKRVVFSGFRPQNLLKK